MKTKITTRITASVVILMFLLVLGIGSVNAAALAKKPSLIIGDVGTNFTLQKSETEPVSITDKKTAEMYNLSAVMPDPLTIRLIDLQDQVNDLQAKLEETENKLADTEQKLDAAQAKIEKIEGEVSKFTTHTHSFEAPYSGTMSLGVLKGALANNGGGYVPFSAFAPSSDPFIHTGPPE
jgi:peptidoglycan hydrolase CwlO-like protein